MAMVLLALQVIVGIGSLVCFVLVIVKMFQTGNTGLGVACIVLLFCGVGGLIAFIWGWMKSGEMGLKNIMLGWTACIVVAIILQVAGLALVGPPALPV